MRTTRKTLGCCLVLVALATCDDSGSTGSNGDGSTDGLSDGGNSNGGGTNGGGTNGGGTNGGGTNGGGSGGFTFPDGGLVGVMSCATERPQCYDGNDNDNDMKTDLADPECTGPCDNDEGSFATGISGDNVDACKQDCFFDGNSGSGNDGCEWNLKCDPASPGATAARACPYDPDYKNCKNFETQSDKCINNCRRVTPNGCDCFGCCALSNGMVTKTVVLSSSCNAASLNDSTKCAPCTQQVSCINTCEKCELCVGKTTLPADCAANPTQPDAGMTPAGDGGVVPPPPPEPVCEAGLISCGAGGDVPATGCPAGQYCITGCCILPVD